MRIIPTHSVAVSACLIGRECRYDGTHKLQDATVLFLKKLRAQGTKVVAVCPEELGGLGTPRPAAELESPDANDVWCGRSRVREVETGKCVTDAFKTGAIEAFDLARGCSLAILKEGSPSCGVNCVWSNGAKVNGRGVFATLLLRRGVKIYSENELHLVSTPGSLM